MGVEKTPEPTDRDRELAMVATHWRQCDWGVTASCEGAQRDSCEFCDVVRAIATARAEGRAEERKAILSEVRRRRDVSEDQKRFVLGRLAEWIFDREEPTDGR